MYPCICRPVLRNYAILGLKIQINNQDDAQNEGEEPVRKRVKFLQHNEPTNEPRKVLCVFPKNPGCTPAGKVSPEDSQGPAISGTTPTARSSKRARENLIGAPTQSKKGKTFHSRVNEFGIDLESPARILGPLTWERGNAGRDQGFRDENVSLVDDIHIQETFDAVETTETVERKSGNIDGIEFVRRIENIEPVKGIVEKVVNIETVEEIVEKIVDIEPVKGIVEKIVNIEPVEGIVEEIMDVEAVEGIVEEVENIVPVEEVVGRFEHVVDGIEFKPARNVESIAECQSGKSHTSLLTEEESGKSHTSLLTEEESGKAEDENENTHTPLLMEEESGTPRNMDRIDYRLGQLEIGSQRSGIATRDVFPIKMNDQLRRRNVEMIHTRRQEASSVKNISSLRDPGYKWQSVDLLSGSEVEVFEPIKRRWSDSRGRCIANTKEEIEEIDCTESSPKIMRTLASIFLIVPIEYSPNQTVSMENENEVDNSEHEEIEIIMVHHIPPAPAGLPVRDALGELRALEMRFGVQNEDEGYASGGEDIDREPLDDRLREMEPQLLDRPLVNLDLEMMEILHRQGAQRNEEPILIENEQPNWARPPFLIEIHLGEFGNPLPIELIELERAPAPGLFEAIAPFLAPIIPQGQGARAMVEALHNGLFRLQPQEGVIQLGHVHGLVALSPDRTMWKCHACVIEEPDAFNGYLGWEPFLEHVLGIVPVLNHIYCGCGRLAFFYEEIDQCRICLQMLRSHWPYIQGGVRLRGEVARVPNLQGY
ncbi:hypothetical protein QAD02_022378 [Eretmocerus hayati]|uniref:Uncharacterized protein n=1 Tax=Eretmocerus hayati TaxID=131215 RepID=A0ACC2PVC4_9HYME|nr:hypothetical protein QAD02_022378 [Eretmocerus hayati]